jgi:hypothetical protein
MKKKGNTAHKKSVGEKPVFCPACGNLEFRRTLSETDSIVKLAYWKHGKAVKETIVSEGNIQFRYCCAKCGAILLRFPGPANMSKIR